MRDDQALEMEIELLQSSLLSAEHLAREDENGTVVLEITSDESRLSLRIVIGIGYPVSGGMNIEVRGSDIGREEAVGWQVWSDDKLKEWDQSEEYPLYQILTTHFLPLLAPAEPDPRSNTQKSPESLINSNDTRPYHVLLTSHHLIAPSKRKDLHALHSQLSLVGFAKTGYPGIIYAIGRYDDLVELVREVKSWQWLALRVRIAPEPVDDDELGGKGKEDGARGGKGRGEWCEVEKIGEAVNWLKMRSSGRERILTDLGIGVG